MKEIIEKADVLSRPNDRFSCSNCPFAEWRNYGFFDEKNELSANHLDCYCTKLHSFTFETGKPYKLILMCQAKITAVNTLLESQ